MIAEVISIGDEMTSGQRLDTNSQFLSQRLGDLGIRVAYHTTVGDALEENVAVFRLAASRADVVISTGGLGPTADDLTRQAMADAFGLPLELRSEALEHIEALFSKRKRPMPERNRVQAMFPRTARIIDNPHGTAPGIDLSVRSSTLDGSGHGCRLFALPGVPAEMTEMMQDTVERRLVDEMGAGANRWRYHCMKLFGIGESDVEKELPELISRDRDPRVGITVSKATITLRIAAATATQEEFLERIEPTRREIRRAFGALVFGEGELDLQDALHAMLIETRRRVGVVEVGSGSWIAPMMSCEQPSSEHGLVVAKWLRSLPDGSPKDGSAEDGSAESLQSVQEQLATMARDIVREGNLDYGLAAGVYPDWESVQSATTLPTTEFCMAVAAGGGQVKTSTIRLGGHPEVFYARLAKTAMNFLRLELLRG